MTPTDAQNIAIESTNNQIFAIAGPGSGKTRTLIWRVLHLIQSGVHAEAIACITFTNAGAREMEKRLAQSAIKIGFVGTLHSFMLNLIRKHGKAVGYPSGRFTILDNEEATEFFQGVLEKHKWKGTAKEVVEAIQQGPPTGDSLIGRACIVAAGYWQELRRAKLLTFDAILILGERLLKTMSLGQVEGGAMTDIPYDHYAIDEVQDSSPIDFRIYNLLLGNKFLVGDPDQSIYKFRGADVAQSVALTRDPNWQTIPLEGNFRSGTAICAAAQRLIEHNQDRFAKQTISANDYPGEVTARRFNSPAVEASFIGQQIAALPDPSEVAVLLRTNDLVQEYANHLRAMSIPVAQSRPPSRPADWPLARSVLAFLTQPENDYTAYRCCARFFNQKKADEIAHKAAVAFTSFNQQWECFSPLTIDTLSSTVRTNLLRLGVTEESITRIFDALSRLPDGAGTAELLLELNREDEYIVGEGVTVGTIHSVKGKEFDHVFVAACEQQVMPSERKSLDLAEERRLCYVAFTRPRFSLHITFCEQRVMKWGSPSPVAVSPSQFITEAGVNNG